MTKKTLLFVGLFLVSALVAFEPMFVDGISFLGRIVLIFLLIASITLINIEKKFYLFTKILLYVLFFYVYATSIPQGNPLYNDWSINYSTARFLLLSVLLLLCMYILGQVKKEQLDKTKRDPGEVKI
jgi:hypothetical protein